jgi:hypothetical protein
MIPDSLRKNSQREEERKSPRPRIPFLRSDVAKIRGQNRSKEILAVPLVTDGIGPATMGMFFEGQHRLVKPDGKTKRPFRNRLSGVQLVEQRLGLLQVQRIEALDEPVVDG